MFIEAIFNPKCEIEITNRKGNKGKEKRKLLLLLLSDSKYFRCDIFFENSNNLKKHNFIKLYIKYKNENL